jgi:hypothetical protein
MKALETLKAKVTGEKIRPSQNPPKLSRCCSITDGDLRWLSPAVLLHERFCRCHDGPAASDLIDRLLPRFGSLLLRRHRGLRSVRRQRSRYATRHLTALLRLTWFGRARRP